MKYFIIVVSVIITFTTCTFFDPMGGMELLEYGSEYTRTFSGEPSVLCENAVYSYSNTGMAGDNVYVVYFDTDKDSLVLSRSRDGGGRWRDAILTTSNCYLICMAVVEGNIYITYEQNTRLYCIVSYDGGTYIRTAQIGSAFSSGDGYTGITGYGNNIYISYCNRTDEVCDVMCAYSRDRGRSFSTSVVEASAQLYASSSGIAYNPQKDKVYITYQHQNADYSYLGFAMSATLDTWETEIFDNTDHRSSAVIAGSGDNLYIVRTGDGPTYYTSTDDGLTWSSGADIDPACNSTADISFVKDGSILYTAYYHASFGQLRTSIFDGAWTAREVDLEGSWGGTTGRKSSITASDNLVFLTYVNNSGELLLSKSTDGGVTWNTD